MTQAEKLEALVQKAFVELREWNGRKINGWSSDTEGERIFISCEGNAYNISVNDFVYNKEVARALFGDTTWYLGRIFMPDYAVENPILQALNNLRWFTGKDTKGASYFDWEQELPAYDYQRQQAVISDDPISYMYKEVFGDDSKS